MSKVLIVGEILIDLVENENGFKYSMLHLMLLIICLHLVMK